MKRREFAQNSFMAALAMAVASSSKVLANVVPGEPVMTMYMDTGVLRHGDIIMTKALNEKGQNVQFFISKDIGGFVAIRIDDPNVRIKIEQEPKLQVVNSYYDKNGQYPMDPMEYLTIPEISKDHCVIVSTAFPAELTTNTRR